jgi:hypothetical protein
MKRAAVLARVAAGDLGVLESALLLGVGERQAKRLWAVYRDDGAAGLVHGNVGRRSNRAKPKKFRARVVRLYRRHYAGDAHKHEEPFGPTLAAEHLQSEHRVTVDAETLRRWLLAEGVWHRVRDAPTHRKRRERKAHFGELVQMDGSFESWLEDRAATSCLMDMVDDATSVAHLRFEAQETIWGAVRSLRGWIERYGIPVALYTDWKNVYVRKPTEAERVEEVVPLTQFGRMCATLGIRIIAASSPQAKGRVERNNGTHQDRFVKKARRLGIRDYATANVYLEATYTPAHNARFAVAAASDADFHTPVPRGLDLDTVFRLEDTRTLTNDWVVRHDNRYVQVARHGRHDPPAQSTVPVCEYEDGHLDVRYRGQTVPWTEIPAPRRSTVPAPAVAADRPLPLPAARRRPAAAHPWRRGWQHLHGEMPWRS